MIAPSRGIWRGSSVSQLGRHVRRLFDDPGYPPVASQVASASRGRAPRRPPDEVARASRATLGARSTIRRSGMTRKIDRSGQERLRQPNFQALGIVLLRQVHDLEEIRGSLPVADKKDVVLR